MLVFYNQRLMHHRRWRDSNSYPSSKKQELTIRDWTSLQLITFHIHRIKIRPECSILLWVQGRCRSIHLVWSSWLEIQWRGLKSLEWKVTIWKVSTNINSSIFCLQITMCDNLSGLDMRLQERDWFKEVGFSLMRMAFRRQHFKRMQKNEFRLTTSY